MTLTRFTLTFAGVLFTSLLASCGSVNEINLAAPQAATLDAPPASERASISVMLETGAGPMPDDVHSTRFRITELWLKRTDGTWTKRQADREAYTVSDDAKLTRTVLATDIPVTGYDSVAVFMNDVYVEYNPNAGGPLTVADTPLKLPIRFTPESNRLTTLTLRYEVANSVRQDSTCRWHFTPELSVTLGAPSDE